MTKQEVKDEYKQTEGNPEIKNRIKSLQRQMASSRMMQKVPQADVIIRNPTHVAIALKYDPDLTFHIELDRLFCRIYFHPVGLFYHKKRHTVDTKQFLRRPRGRVILFCITACRSYLFYSIYNKLYIYHNISDHILRISLDDISFTFICPNESVA